MHKCENKVQWQPRASGRDRERRDLSDFRMVHGGFWTRLIAAVFQDCLDYPSFSKVLASSGLTRRNCSVMQMTYCEINSSTGSTTLQQLTKRVHILTCWSNGDHNCTSLDQISRWVRTQDYNPISRIIHAIDQSMPASRTFMPQTKS